MKKLLASFFLAIVLLMAVFVPFARAADTEGPWYNQSFTQWSNKVFEEGNETEIFGERYTFAQVSWIFNSLAAIAIGTDLLECVGVASESTVDQFKSCLAALKPVESGQILGSNLKQNPSIASVALAGDSLSPAFLPSGIKYFSDSLKKFHIIPEAKAQGFGYSTLQPIQKAWKASRDISYALMIVVVVVISFMIMFRVKISPQVVITVQSALPKIIIALLLITFSYAIVGLIIDLSYVLVGIIAAAAKTGGLAGVGPGPEKTIPELFNRLLFGHPLGSLVLTMSLYVLLAFAGALAVGWVTSWTTGGAFLPFLGGATVGAVILILLFAILILIISIRILWLKIKTFVNIVLLIITGPFQILFGAVSPGMGGFGAWFKNLAANVIVFPIIIIMGFLAHFFFWGFWSADDWLGQLLSRGSWLNPFEISTTAVSEGQITVPGFGGDATMVGFLVAFGILFLIPHAANIIKSMIEGKPFAYGTAIGEGLNPYGLTGYGVSYGIGKGTDVISARLPASSVARKAVESIGETAQKWASSGFKSR